MKETERSGRGRRPVLNGTKGGIFDCGQRELERGGETLEAKIQRSEDGHG